jgi:membrane-associated protease RseP (regulator of RpoE activity)
MVAPPSRSELLKSSALFILTFLSVFLVHLFNWGGGAWEDRQSVVNSILFASALMGILLAHELGHWVVARWHGFEQSLPIFLPVPFGFGTMGAIIRLKSMPRSRAALLEMGAAGPLAGAVVSFLILLGTLPYTREDVVIPEGTLVTIFNDPLIVKILGTLVLGHSPGRYSEFHPAALAAWVGCFLTGINLLPIGQLDGGHVLNGRFPKIAQRFSTWIPIAMIGFGLTWGLFSLVQGEVAPGAVSWFMWGMVIRFVGADRPIPVPETGLGTRAKWVAFLILLLFILTFIPVPMEVETVPKLP